MIILELSKENLHLAAYEAEVLFRINEYRLDGCFLFCEIYKQWRKRMHRAAYTKKAYELLFVCAMDELASALQKYDYTGFYKKDFCLRIHHLTNELLLKESDYAKYLWRSLVSKGIAPRVNLRNPSMLIELFVAKDCIYVTRQIFVNDEDFESRQAHLRPVMIPTSLHPRLARAVVNIVDAQLITDPFCGTGGFLIEAGLMGLKIRGYDIDDKILKMAEQNLKYYNIKGILKRRDALTLNHKKIVTDLPYGKSSRKTKEISSLYAMFLSKIVGRSVIIFPDIIDYESILADNLSKKLSVIRKFPVYVHKSLTRIIIVIDEK